MRSQITLATLRTSVVLGARLLVQSGTLLIIARLLGPNEYGAFAGITSLAVILGTLSTFGTHIVLLAEVSRNPFNRVQILPFAITTTLLCSCILLGIYILITLLISTESNISFGVKFSIGVSELLILPLITIPSAEHQGHGRIARSQLLMTFPLILRFIVAIVVWLVGSESPLPQYAYGYLCASVFALFVATRSLRDTWPPLSSWRLPTKGELQNTAGYALLNITAVGPTELDKTLAPRVLTATTAGIYSAGARIIGALTLPVIALMLSAMPKLFRDNHANVRRTGKFLIVLVGASLGYSVILDIALWLTAPMFDQLFGPQYTGMHYAIRWLCVAVPGMSLRITLGSILMSLRHPWLRAAFEFVGLVTLCIAALTLAPRYDLVGMALALAASEWSMAIIGALALVVIHQRRSGLI